MERHINRTYLGFLAQIIRGVLLRVFVSKTYRHLRLGGIASGSGVVSQQNDVFEPETPHIFNSIVVQSYHNLTK